MDLAPLRVQQARPDPEAVVVLVVLVLVVVLQLHQERVVMDNHLPIFQHQ